MTGAAERETGTGLARYAMVTALAWFVLLQEAAFRLAGVFEYPLDDVYIHLAMADGIARGTYGVNLGEPASAASSILYPFLLIPFHGSDLQRFLPLLWNLLALGLGGWLWGRTVEMAGLGRRAGLALALVGPVLLDMAVVAFTGMEHALHTALSLAVLLGLLGYLRGGRVAWWFVAAAILAPLVRYEGLALSLGVAVVLAVTGRWRAGLGLAAAVLVPVAGFSAFLHAEGLALLPSSVLAKLTPEAAGEPLWRQVADNLAMSLGNRIGQVLAAEVLVLAGVAVALRGRRIAFLPALLALAGMAHLMLGKIGWMHRYEQYILLTLTAGMLISLGRPGLNRAGLATAAGALAMAGAASWYAPALALADIWGPRAVHLQQAQMARFAQEFLKAPVAVNDIGRVAWRNPDYVLDLWGLASQAARETRLAVPAPPDGWAEPLAKAHGVVAAMLYDRWLGRAAGRDWVPLAHLLMDHPIGTIADYDVTFYATGPAQVDRVEAALKAFAPTLPPEAHLVMMLPPGR